MKNYSPESAMTEHLLTGHSASSIEATLLFGIRNPNAFFSRLRKEGHRIQRKEVPMVKVIRRLNEYSQFDSLSACCT